MIEQKDKKFTDVIEVSDWEIETDSGWQDIKRIGKTIEYEKWIIKTSSHFLECADEHIIFLSDYSEIYVKDVKVGDLIITESGIESVISVVQTGEFINMYDVEVDHMDHRYWTNGILSHNTLWLGNIGVQAVKASNNVAIITLELSDRKYMKRIGSNLLGIRMSEYKDTAENEELMKKKIKNIAFDNLTTPGELVIKEFGTSQASAIDIENWLTKVEQVLNIKFKIVIIDYINIMKNWRNPNSENTYMKIKQIAEDLRSAAQRNNWAIISATQTKQCLTLDTKIETKNKGLISILDLKIGDYISCEQGWTKVLYKTLPEKQKIYKITTASGKSIKCSGNHRFPTADGLELKASILKIGDVLLSKIFEPKEIIDKIIEEDPIISIEEIGEEDTIDIMVDNSTHLFFANGILTHNSEFDASDLSMNSASESSGLVATVDGMFGIIQDPLMLTANEYKLKLLANRDEGYKNSYKKFIVDYNFMRIAEDQNSQIMND